MIRYFTIAFDSLPCLLSSALPSAELRSIGRRPLRNRRDVAEQEPLCSSHYVLLWKHRQVLGLRNIGEWFVPPITRFLPHANSTHVPRAADATNYMA